VLARGFLEAGRLCWKSIDIWVGQKPPSNVSPSKTSRLAKVSMDAHLSVATFERGRNVKGCWVAAFLRF
jgi:hypothetical protein